MIDEFLYNHLEICTFIYNGNTQAAIHALAEKIKALPIDTPLKIKKTYLYTLNHSIYHYILTKEKVSLHRCCYENDQAIGEFFCSPQFLTVGKNVLLAYTYCSEYLIEKHSNKHVKNAISYIHNHLDMPLSLEEVCKNIHINRCYLSEIFKKQVNCTFTQYVLKQRISLAKKLLRDSSLNVHMIAEKCGFSNHSYFCTCFKKVVGLSPCAYRNESYANTCS